MSGTARVYVITIMLMLLSACTTPTMTPTTIIAEATGTMTDTPEPTASATGTPSIEPSPSVSPTASAAPSPTNTPAVSPTPECAPNDQDQYVYKPSRLKVMSSCIHVTGFVQDAVVNQEDGDGLFGLKLDPPFLHFLTSANYSAYKGALHLEIPCYTTPIGPMIKMVCATDPDPLRLPLPKVGQHLWVEGRWVLDIGHTGYSELHPVYRWGELP